MIHDGHSASPVKIERIFVAEFDYLQFSKMTNKNPNIKGHNLTLSSSELKSSTSSVMVVNKKNF